MTHVYSESQNVQGTAKIKSLKYMKLEDWRRTQVYFSIRYGELDGKGGKKNLQSLLLKHCSKNDIVSMKQIFNIFEGFLNSTSAANKCGRLCVRLKYCYCINRMWDASC